MEGHEVRLRGQTAGVGIRLNPKLANQYGRGGLASQSNVIRRENGNKSGSPSYFATQEDERDNDQHFKIMNKTGGFAYPGQPLKVSTESVLGQTLNKFELGEVNSSKLKTVSGVEYYK